MKNAIITTKQNSKDQSKPEFVFERKDSIEVVYVNKDNISKNPFAKMDWETDSIMREIG